MQFNRESIFPSDVFKNFHFISLSCRSFASSVQLRLHRATLEEVESLVEEKRAPLYQIVRHKAGYFYFSVSTNHTGRIEPRVPTMIAVCLGCAGCRASLPLIATHLSTDVAVQSTELSFSSPFFYHFPRDNAPVNVARRNVTREIRTIPGFPGIGQVPL